MDGFKGALNAFKGVVDGFKSTIGLEVRTLAVRLQGVRVNGPADATKSNFTSSRAGASRGDWI